MSSDGDIRELVPLTDGAVFSIEELKPIFCKPKLLPMKTITMEKLEQMQREAERMVLQQQQHEEGAIAEVPGTTPTDENDEKITEVWTAND